MVTDMSMSHFVDQSAHLSNEPYSSSTCYYLLISQDGCQTTWHQDFSATSVFYTVLRGEKIFFVVKPTVRNERLFQRWSDSESDEWYGYTFFSTGRLI